MNRLFFVILFFPFCCFGQRVGSGCILCRLWMHPEPTTTNVKMILEGNFTGKNVYIINPDTQQSDSLEQYCTIQVFVNGIEITFGNSPAFEIDLIGLGLILNAPVLIEIVHYDDCKPRLIVQNGCLTGGN